MNTDRLLSIVTFAALAGLFVLNYRGATEVIGAIGSSTVNYVKAVQGR